MSASELARHPSFELDQHHARLLRSADESEVLLGVASVTYWGYARGPSGRLTLGRALARAGWLAGKGKHGADSDRFITAKVRQVLSLVDRGDRQSAIREAMSLRFHGLAFASKLLAFCSPHSECVYDSVISRRLGSSKDKRLRELHVDPDGRTRIAEKADAYEGWARLCSEKAEELNKRGVRWTDWDGQEHIWRAVDVERAFFALGRQVA